MKLALLVHQIANSTGNELGSLPDGGRAESGEVEEQELATVARQQMIGNGGRRVGNNQGRDGTRHLAGHGCPEPETQIFQVGIETVKFDGGTATFTRFSGREVLLQEKADVFGRNIGTPTKATDFGARIGCSKGAEDGNGGIRGQSLVMDQLRADAELVGLVEVCP